MAFQVSELTSTQSKSNFGSSKLDVDQLLIEDAAAVAVAATASDFKSLLASLENKFRPSFKVLFAATG